MGLKDALACMPSWHINARVDDDSVTAAATVPIDAEVAARARSASRSQTPPPPGASGRARLEGPSASVAASTDALATARDALHEQQIADNRTYFGWLIPLSLCGAVGMALFLGGDPTAKKICAVSLVTVSLVAAWYRRSLRGGSYSAPRAFVVEFVANLCGLSFTYYAGICSPAVAVLCLGLHKGSSAQGSGQALFNYVTASVGYLLLVVLVGGNFIHDPGLVSIDKFTLAQRAAGAALIEALFFVIFIYGRAGRLASESAIARQVEATRKLALREGLLQEARQELERALDFAGLGRFSETTIGSFRLGKVIGRGGMGEVYDAVHVETGAAAAVKLLVTLGSADAIQRFLREAQIASSLVVPNVVRVIEVGDLSASLPYIAMERLRGEDLSDYLRRHDRMPFETVVAMVRDVGRGLEAARVAGIVHRDLKPRNVFMADTGGDRVFKILDFGISKLAGSDHTQPGDRMMGTPAYMAPEHVLGQEVSYRSDLFSLGAIAYRALTGRPAFTGEVLARLTTPMPPRPSSLASLHPQLDYVLAIALAHTPGDRWGSGAELAEALEAAAAGALGGKIIVRAERILAELPWASVT